MRAEHATVDVRLVDDHVPQVVQDVAPAVVVGHHPDVEHVGIREDHVRASADVASLLRRGVAVVDRDAEPGKAEGRQRAGLILRERLRGVEQERAGMRVAGNRLQDGEGESKRLPRRGRRRDDRAVTCGSDVPELGLVRPEPGDAAAVERRSDSRGDVGNW